MTAGASSGGFIIGWADEANDYFTEAAGSISSTSIGDYELKAVFTNTFSEEPLLLLIDATDPVIDVKTYIKSLRINGQNVEFNTNTTPPVGTKPNADEVFLVWSAGPTPFANAQSYTLEFEVAGPPNSYNTPHQVSSGNF